MSNKKQRAINIEDEIWSKFVNITAPKMIFEASKKGKKISKNDIIINQIKKLNEKHK